jgi:hypothetical protein
MLPSLLLIAGVPGAGKSSFVRWLDREQGFSALRWDEEADRPAIEAVLALALANESAKAQALIRRLGERVVIEYGFQPGQSDHHVEALKRIGFDAWWFDVDSYDDALKAFRKREGPTDEEAFKRQVALIRSHRARIQRLFADRFIVTLRQSKHLVPEDVWSEIVKTQQTESKGCWRAMRTVWRISTRLLGRG